MKTKQTIRIEDMGKEGTLQLKRTIKSFGSYEHPKNTDLKYFTSARLGGIPCIYVGHPTDKCIYHRITVKNVKTFKVIYI